MNTEQDDSEAIQVKMVPYTGCDPVCVSTEAPFSQCCHSYDMISVLSQAY